MNTLSPWGSGDICFFPNNLSVSQREKIPLNASLCNNIHLSVARYGLQTRMWRPTGLHFRTTSLRLVHFTTWPNDHSTILRNYADDTRQFKWRYICQWRKMFIKGCAKIWLGPTRAVTISDRLNWILKQNLIKIFPQIIESFHLEGNEENLGTKEFFLFSLQSTFHQPDGCSAVYFVHHFGFNRSGQEWEQSPGLPWFSYFSPASETTPAQDIDVTFPFWIAWPHF